MRLYVINSTELIPVVQRHFRILDFAPLEAKSAINVMGASELGKEIVLKNDFAYPILFHKAIHPAVTPGPLLDSMNREVVQKVTETMETLASQAPRTLKLFEWVKTEIARATTEAAYGPQNPFRDAKVQMAYE